MTITVMLIGKTGAGKSLLANTFFNLQLHSMKNYTFKVADKPTSTRESTEPQSFTKSVHGISLRVIDTPGFFDKELQVRERWVDVLKAVKLAGHIDSVIVVIDVRQLASGADCTEIVQKHVGNFLTNRVVIVFSHIGNADKTTCEEYLKQFNSHLKNGILGARFVFSDQRAPLEVKSEKMKEIVEHLKSIKEASPSYIELNNFCELTETYFKEKINAMHPRHIEYNSLANDMDLNIELLLEFMSKKKMQELIRERNQEKLLAPSPKRKSSELCILI